jgi:uncharacterized protein YciI
VVDPTASLDDLLRDRHAELDLWLLTLRPVGSGKPDDPDEARELLRRHFVFWWELEEAGVLLAAGPVDLESPERHGMAILMAVTREEAERLAREEPFHVAGHRVNGVSHWQLNEGLAVDFVRSLLQG